MTNKYVLKFFLLFFLLLINCSFSQYKKGNYFSSGKNLPYLLNSKVGVSIEKGNNQFTQGEKNAIHYANDGKSFYILFKIGNRFLDSVNMGLRIIFNVDERLNIPSGSSAIKLVPGLWSDNTWANISESYTVGGFKYYVINVAPCWNSNVNPSQDFTNCDHTQVESKIKLLDSTGGTNNGYLPAIKIETPDAINYNLPKVNLASTYVYPFNNLSLNTSIYGISSFQFDKNFHPIEISNLAELSKFEFSLPVDLLFFTAELKQKGVVEVLWATASEKELDYFEVHRSTDAINFIPISNKIDAKGTTFNRSDYNYEDQLYETGVYYYRLKQSDFNGDIKYSLIVPINYLNDLDISKNDNLRIVALNAVNGNLYVMYNSPSQDKVTVNIFSTLGVHLVSEFDQPIIGGNIKAINFNSSPGVFVVLITNNKQADRQKFTFNNYNK